jgi:hypothetical protein
MSAPFVGYTGMDKVPARSVANILQMGCVAARRVLSPRVADNIPRAPARVLARGVYGRERRGPVGEYLSSLSV